MKNIGVIPTRYQSPRFPGKPLADICGRHMIWWVYQQCLIVTRLDKTCVATDDKRIQEVCKRYERNVVMISDKHKTGSDCVGEVATKVDDDLFINIQGDEPLIDLREIEKVISIFDDATVDFGTLRIEITAPEGIQAYCTVKVACNNNSNVMYFSHNVIPSNRKDGPLARAFRNVGIYAYRKQFLLRFVNMPQLELELGEGIEPLRAMENGYRIKVKETKYQRIGVDYPEHIRLVEEDIWRWWEIKQLVFFISPTSCVFIRKDVV